MDVGINPQAVEQTVQRLTALLRVSHILASETDVDRLLGAIIDCTSEVLEADRSTLFLIDERHDELRSRVAQGHNVTEIRVPLSAGIAGHVATTGETLIIPDAYLDPRFNPDVDRETGYRTRSILCVPLRDSNGRMIGALQALNKRAGPFTSDDAELLAALASQAAVALTNASLLEARRKEVEKSRTLLDVMTSLSSELELDQLLAKIMEKTTEVMRADRSSLFILDAKQNELWFKVAQGANLEEVRIPVGVGIAGHVAATGETINIADAYADPRFNQDVDRRTGYRTRTVLCMPMRNAQGSIVGVLQVLNKIEGLFSEDDEALLEAVGSQAAIALENAQLFERVVQMKNYNESVLSSMANGVVTLDLDGRISTMNPAAQRILSLDPETSVVRTLPEAVRGDVNGAITEPAMRAMRDCRIVRAEKIYYQTPEGNRATINLSAVPLLDHRSTQIGVVMVIEDISREQQLMGTLSRVVSRQVAEQLFASGQMPSVGGQRKDVTVLMSDIRDFTPMTEKSEPEAVVSMLNDYFGRMIEIVFRHEGTLDKFIGDAIMAVFGTPIAHADDPLRAIQAAIDMRRALRAFNEERRAAGQQPIEIGIGICNGEAVSGAIGSEERLEFTVIGDTVNTAARLEGLTKGFPDHKIVFNEAVYDLVRDVVPCDFLADEYVKGKAQPVHVYGISERYIRSG
ncbi:MAG TPA: GAF domain-containing protein [Chloroflexota bacterium]|nr:GAF domain-containing protein [Chloroflexota bacterium]